MKVVFKKSTNMKKKLMALFFEKNEDGEYKKIKTTHFGSAGMSDYTIHNDKDRRKRYLDRHKKNENWGDPMTAGSLSKHILWGDNTSKKDNIRAFKNKFGFE